MEPVCNKINRGVAREDIRGGKTEWRGRGEEEEDGRVNGPAQEEGGWLGRTQAHLEDAEEGCAEEGSEGRQNHPAAGYSHPLDEATDCDGVPPSSTTASSSSCSSAVVVSPSSSPVPTRHLFLLPFPTAYFEPLQNGSR